MDKKKFTCQKCHKVYVNEKLYLKHKCKQMKREDELKSLTGTLALEYYQHWMKLKTKKIPSPNHFLTSNYFKTFFKFVDFCKQIKLPLPNKFIWFTVERNYPPTMWMNDDVYVEYIDFLDSSNKPIDQVKQSITNLLDYSDRHRIDCSSIFEHININELLYMIRIRQVSPWIIIFSKTFKNVITNCSSEQQQILETLIRPEYWINKKQQLLPDDANTIKLLVSSMGL